MASVLTSSTVDHEFEPRSGQTKDYNIGICCFSGKYSALRRKRKELALDNNLSLKVFYFRLVYIFVWL